MAIIDLGSPPTAPASSLLEALPRRLSLTLSELRLIADLAGDAPLPFEAVDPARPAAYDGRLGEGTGAPDAAAYAAALTSLHEPRSSLTRRGLLVGDVVDDGLLGAVGLLAAPSLAVDLDLAVGTHRARSWHRHRDGAVASLATSDGLVFELAWFPVARWADELGRVAVLPEEAEVRPSAVPEQVELPFALADAAGEAFRTHRADLVTVLTADHTGRTRYADGSTAQDRDVAAILTGLASESRGRLRALVADVSGAETTVVGVVSWLLLADGWRALRPRHVDGVDRVQIERVDPRDLATELAPVLAEARA